MVKNGSMKVVPLLLLASTVYAQQRSRRGLRDSVLDWFGGAGDTSGVGFVQPTPPPSQPAPTPPPVPDVQFVPTNTVPCNPPRGYFNYDIDDLVYGPNNWGNVNTSDHPLYELGPFGFGTWKGLLSNDPTRNRCGCRPRNQSPKNLVQANGTEIPGDCLAYHEIRTNCGLYPVNSDRYQKLILPHKLTMIMYRRPCSNTLEWECVLDHPPMADYPKYFSFPWHESDMLNLDIKYPGEHTLEGETFDAEIQQFHAHLDGHVSSIGIPVRAKAGGHNEEFQEILNEFQKVYDRHAQTCANQSNRELRGASLGLHNLGKNGTDEDLDDAARFNPYSEALMPGMFFYRYEGSTTEPPCLDITWWVMMEPMIISPKQLNQIKYLLFTHVNGQCQKTSVHNADQQATRPIQPLDGSIGGIRKCGPGYFESDLVQEGTAARRC